MKYAGIIFDLDGVICSTDHYHYLAWKKLANRLDIPFNETTNNRLRGISRMDSLAILLEKSKIQYSTDEKLAFADEKNQTYRELLSQMDSSSLTEEVRSTLRLIRKQDCKLAIGSSSKNTRFILERLGLTDFFDAVVDGTCVAHSKPHPEVFLKAAESLGLQPYACLVVEDAHAGVEAAKAGGFSCAAMGDATDDERADFHLCCFSDLLHILALAS